LKRVGGRGLERMLEGLSAKEEGRELGEDGEKGAVFEEGWGDFAKNQYRTVVFSKSYCPYSRKAKEVLAKYRLTPSPFIIEIDRRSDMTHLQSLLQHLTSRRTVPNILFDFTSFGGSDELVLSDSEGGLQRRFEDMELLPGFRRRKGLAKKRIGQVPPVPPLLSDDSMGPAAVPLLDGQPIAVRPLDLITPNDQLPLPQPQPQLQPQEPLQLNQIPPPPLANQLVNLPVKVPPFPPIQEEPRVIIRPEPKPVQARVNPAQRPKPKPKPVVRVQPRVEEDSPVGIQRDGVAAIVAAAKMRRPGSEDEVK